MATISFLFVWGMIMLAHLRYKKLHPHSTDFRMPLYPFADYLVLGFLLLTAVIMMFDRAMLSALIFAIVWIATLFILRRLRRAEKAA
jgi:AAT family amino acid transporter